jgi:hypothetical protein
MFKLTGSIAMVAMMLTVSAMVGCESQQNTEGRETAYWRDTETQQPAPAPEPAPAPKTGMVSSSVPFPTGVTPGSGLLVTKTAPAQVVVNADFDYTITAKNLTKFTLVDVKVTDKMPASFKLNSSNPQGTVAGDTGTWQLGDLGSGPNQDHHDQRHRH